MLRQQARDNIQNHIQESIPHDYQRCLTGLNQVLKTCWYIVNIPNPNSEDKIKLQATAFISDSYKYIMDLTSNGNVFSHVLKFVNGKAQKLNESLRFSETYNEVESWSS